MFEDPGDPAVFEELAMVAASGSCVRCGRALGLASAKVDGRWYGNAICATGAPCPLDREAPRVPEPRLYSRPRRYLRKRRPKELRTGA
ncbi:MAG: hypothetical protein OZ948_05765 [Deltaproteobacteria bacterium]|nr:hypothetical protein [Deltaproteobacteria bacterium]